MSCFYYIKVLWVLLQLLRILLCYCYCVSPGDMILSPDSSQQCCPQPPRVPEPSAPSPTTVGHREPALNIGTYVYKWMTTTTTTTTYLYIYTLWTSLLAFSYVICVRRKRKRKSHALSFGTCLTGVCLCYRIRWDHSAMPGVRGQGIWLPLRSTFMRGMQGN